MVDANLKKLFASEGVGVIGLRAGGEHLVAELRGSGPAETVVLAALPGAKAPLPVSFERGTAHHTYDVEVAAESDAGVRDDFVPAGVLVVRR